MNLQYLEYNNSISRCNAESSFLLGSSPVTVTWMDTMSLKVSVTYLFLLVGDVAEDMELSDPIV